MAVVTCESRDDLWVDIPEKIEDPKVWASEAAAKVAAARGVAAPPSLNRFLEAVGAVPRDGDVVQRFALIGPDLDDDGWVLDIGFDGRGEAPSPEEVQQQRPDLPPNHVEALTLDGGTPAVRLTEFGFLPPAHVEGASATTLEEVQFCAMAYTFAVRHEVEGPWRAWALMTSPRVTEMVVLQTEVMELLGSIAFQD